MKTFFCGAFAFFASISFAAKPAEVKYKRTFENPIVDARINFAVCAIDGALYGVAQGKPGNVLCWGNLASEENKKNATTYYVFKKAGAKTQSYYEQLSDKVTGGWGQDGMGVQESKVVLRTLKTDLTKPAKTAQSTLKFRLEFMDSEGNVMVKGKLPGTTFKLEAPVFSLGSIDEDLQHFLSEIGE